jgi:hypothetical protein
VHVQRVQGLKLKGLRIRYHVSMDTRTRREGGKRDIRNTKRGNRVQKKYENRKRNVRDTKQGKDAPSPCMSPSPPSPPPSNRGSSLARECRSVTRLVGCTAAMSDANSVCCGC